MWASFDDWVADARGADIVDVATSLGATLKRAGRELVGPCPGCGGTDRFSINSAKRMFNCGHHGGAGGDVIALVGHVMGLDARRGEDFVLICEQINGAPAPDRGASETDEERRARLERVAARARDEAEKAAQREREAEAYRDAEIRRAFDLWQEGRPIASTPVAAYLAARGIRHIAGLRLRAHPCCGYFVRPERAKGFVKVGEFWAMLGAIADGEGRFDGVHITYLDPSEPRKAVITHPETGEMEPAKKIRGSVHGGVMRLAGPVEPVWLAVGEGIETVLSVRDDDIDSGIDIAGRAYWSGVSLGNLGGAAMETVPHPLGLTKTDKAGRNRLVRVPGPVPDMSKPGVFLPTSVSEALILGDGDSEPATTEFATRRCAARWARPGLVIRRAWAGDGNDFNDLRRSA